MAKKSKKNVKRLNKTNANPVDNFINWLSKRVNFLLNIQPEGLTPEEYALSVFAKNVTLSHISFTESARHKGDRRDILEEFDGEYIMGHGTIGAFRWFPMPDGTKELRILIYEPYLVSHISGRPRYNSRDGRTEWFVEDTWKNVYEIDDHIWITASDTTIVNQKGDKTPVSVGLEVGFIAKASKYNYAEKFGLTDVFIVEIGVSTPVSAKNDNTNSITVRHFPATELDLRNHNYIWFDNKTRKFFTNKEYDNLYKKVVSSWHNKGGYIDGLDEAFSQYGFALTVEVLMLYDVEYLKRSIRAFGIKHPRTFGNIERLAKLEMERKSKSVNKR